MDEVNGVDLSVVNSLGLDFSPTALICGLLFGVIGVYVFRHGKKTLNYSLIFVSILMMCYTAFIHVWWQHWTVGIILCAIAYQINKNGGEMTG